MKIEDQITSAALAAVKDLYGVEVPEKMIQLQKTRSDFEGNLTLVTFPLLKTSHKKPEDTAQDLGEYLKKNCKAVADFNVVKGFLNLVIAQSAWVGLLNDINGDEKFGEKRVTDDSPLVMIEYSSPNTNKPLHLGHVRNNLLGWSLAQIMEANGNKVVKTNIVNDRGIHICKSMLAWLKWGNGITPEKAGKKGDHLIGDFYVLFDKHFKEECKQLQEQYEKEGMTTDEAKAKAEQEAPLIKEAHEMLVKWENNDPEIRALWEKMNSWVYAGFDETYKALGVGFDKIYYESNTYLVGKKKVEEGLKKGLFIRKDDNSVWADLTNEGLDQKLLLRKDGTSVYMTQDIGTAEMRFNDFPIDKMIYVVGNEQNYHFQVLSILLDRLGFKWGKDLVHFSYGMVELPNGKMKSREGTVVDADDLVASMIENAKTLSEDKVNKLEGITEEEKNEIARIVGMGALKYFILKVDARKNMLFNPEESIDFNGNTGPFIQYTYARIRSILRKAEAQNITLPDTLNDDAPLNEKEIALIQKLNDFSVAVAQAGVDYSPSGIANYCYELTKEFNQFYHDYSILNADTEAEKITRLVLAKNVAKVIKNGMALLGIEVPERM
ncbi:arginine--tRNA ligase [Prevotella histicola]|jgi:arginine--tRNA ligase|uniref:Arginine--tRNA ligase n=1 Tax=Prevotella histicola F0411 TaxID=857291 RepID=G6AJM7_9BACT|nr:arginine--tRNA ligase [Prevotella histicola]EHG15126.1 arginyl-tRNA synthetase [Prevotella histicola F0411]MBF1398256.1 arginine--tRNA ligase [Prevotella histicola]MBF1402225.1 arginine--tRNA ligase [Prevotella histicola]MBF1411038.1 arginine--tRNA ligase [Prevotella histicola]MBW4739351.1 arginine--tRNA ligase [Prevotella histicola]